MKSLIWKYRTRTGIFLPSSSLILNDQINNRAADDKLKIELTVWRDRIASTGHLMQTPFSCRWPAIIYPHNYAMRRYLKNKKKRYQNDPGALQPDEARCPRLECCEDFTDRCPPLRRSCSSKDFRRRCPPLQCSCGVAFISWCVHGESLTRHMLDREEDPERCSKLQKQRKDQHFSPVQPNDYVKFRLEKQLSFYEGRLPMYSGCLLFSKFFVVILTSCSAILAYLGHATWVAVAMAVSAAAVSWIAYASYDPKLRRYNSAIVKVKNLISKWTARSEIDKSCTSAVAALVSRGEQIIMCEVESWFSTMERKRIERENKDGAGTKSNSNAIVDQKRTANERV